MPAGSNIPPACTMQYTPDPYPALDGAIRTGQKIAEAQQTKPGMHLMPNRKDRNAVTG
jgi:hypothetical protein